MGFREFFGFNPEAVNEKNHEQIKGDFESALNSFNGMDSESQQRTRAMLEQLRSLAE